MRKVFLDANVVIDCFLERGEFSEQAKQILYLANTLNINVSVITIIFLHYRMEREKINENKILSVLNELLKIITLVELDIQTILLSTHQPISKDFEDNVQYYSAIKNAEVIISRNVKDFKNSSIPVMTPEEFLKKN